MAGLKAATHRLAMTQYLVEGAGFEPAKASAGRFTVCSLWPLGNPSMQISAV